MEEKREKQKISLRNLSAEKLLILKTSGMGPKRLNIRAQAIDVASQISITRDNISVEVDGILYLQEFGKIAKESNTMILPSNMADISSIIATATKVFDTTKKLSLIHI